MYKINPFKLYFYRRSSGYSLEELSMRTGIKLRKLKRLELGKSHAQGKPENIADFADVDDESLQKIASALECKPDYLKGGQDDDFSINFVYNYESRESEEKPIDIFFDERVNLEPIHPKAIVFDFDGTLSKPGTNRTTWERIWIELGYTPTDCGILAQKFFRNEIDHDQWCRLTLEKFKLKNLKRDTVLSIGRSIEMIDGFEEAIAAIYHAHIPMYIVSGSIWDVVMAALDKTNEFFERIEANNFNYSPDGIIKNIVGTEFDFEGKAEFINKLAEELYIPTSEILFIGNSINDEQVKFLSDAKTLLVNPHLTVPSTEWDLFMPEMKNLKEILPIIGVSENSEDYTAKGNNKIDNVATLLESLENVDLKSFVVVGGYLRFNRTVRDRLISLNQEIKLTLQDKPHGRQNYLISAAPGSGKTYLVQEIAGNLGDQIQFIQIDLSKDSESEIRTKLDQIGNEDKNCLCMIDEIDGRKNETWPYEIIYKKLDINEEDNCENTTVFVLIGSSGENPEELKEIIQKRYKGKDLIDRIPEGSYYIHIPPLDIGDAMFVYISKALDAAREEGFSIEYIEKLAVFHAIKTKMKSPRQIKMLADHAVARLGRNETILRYDHHFNPGDWENKEFSSKFQHEFQSLKEELIKIAV